MDRLRQSVDLGDGSPWMPSSVDHPEFTGCCAKEPLSRHDLSAPQFGAHLIELSCGKAEFKLIGLVHLHQRLACLPNVLDAHCYMKPIQNVGTGIRVRTLAKPAP